ncbi:chitooligosaccharide oxidase [Xylariales sp. PMI_506]|nr:chitooligosaccharide oxidase [Xylariales sp. PMI_506]
MLPEQCDPRLDPTAPLISRIQDDRSRKNQDAAGNGSLRLKSLLNVTGLVVISVVTTLVLAGVLFRRAGTAHFHTSLSLASCLSDAKITFVDKNSQDWPDRILSWNRRLTYTPAAVAIPQSTDQIQAAILCGISSQVRVSAKAGGHSFGSYGLGGEDGHLVIELEQMHDVQLHKENNTATIQPGARLGHVSVELYNQGHRAIPHGACPGVGLAGHVLHGGYGRASRTYGLTLDWLVGATVILANGAKVHCSATENKDLFWALRGAGSSFGIVAEFEFKTFAAPERVTPFTIELSWNRESATRALDSLQEIAISAPEELNLYLFVSSTVGQVIQGLYIGDEHGLERALDTLLERLGEDANVLDSHTVGWLEGLEYFSDGENLDQTYPYSSHATYYTTSLLTPALTYNQIGSLMEAMFTGIDNTSAPHTWDIFFEMYGGAKSSVAQIDPRATAYVHRDKMILFQLSDVDETDSGTFPEERFALLKSFQNIVTKSMENGSWGMYANFLDTQLERESAQALYWGDNLPRLRGIKAELDPDDVFWNPQGIDPSS